MLSESQERMLMVLKPGREAEAAKIFHKWELDFAVIGKLTNTGHLVCFRNGKKEVDISVGPLVEQSPLYNRPWEPTPEQPAVDAKKYPLPQGASPLTILQKLLATPDLCSRRWIWEQYDSLIGANTSQGPGGDAAVVRLDGSNKALAMTVDCSPRYCAADPVMGGKQAVVETYRNLCAVGAKPMAITDNMNFGNPEKPRIMGQFVGAVQGIKEACLALDYPIVSGNCSLYNETNGNPILPAPVIGGVGLIADVTKTAKVAFKPDEAIILIGETRGHIGQSLYLLIALAEMALAGDVGCSIEQTGDGAFWFGEDQARYVVTVKDADDFQQKLEAADIRHVLLGQTGGIALVMKDVGSVELADLRGLHEGWFDDYMSH
jgi:phosphoribosylformylglycinamidine synthase